MHYIVLVIISLGFAVLLYWIADKRGANKIFWALMGFVFGPLALPFVFFAKKQTHKHHADEGY